MRGRNRIWQAGHALPEMKCQRRSEVLKGRETNWNFSRRVSDPDRESLYGEGVQETNKETESR
jgi:hypothetical protein